jgi:hypothetical protein
MGRPRTNPDDPKWQEKIIRPFRRNDYWHTTFAAALGGFIARGGLQYSQMIQAAADIADEAQKAIYKKKSSS